MIMSDIQYNYVIMKNYIYGIKSEGVSIEVTRLSINDDQSSFDYICNVLLSYERDGNGEYDVSITNKDFVKGMSIGNWRIIEAEISYDWGSSYGKIRMVDKDGNKTDLINVVQRVGSKNKDFSIPIIIEAIFTEVQKIVRDYPNALICNEVFKFQKFKMDVENVYKFLKKPQKGSDNYIDYFANVTERVSKFLNEYKNIRNLLADKEDERSKILLESITLECKDILDRLYPISN